MRYKYEFDTSKIAVFLEAHNITPMGLVRMAGLSVQSAYKISHGQPVRDLTTLYTLWQSLRENGHPALKFSELTGFE